jgi:hypothetical protein
MFKGLLCVLTVGAVALSPCLATAKSGGMVGGGSKIANSAPVRQPAPQASTLAFKKMKIIHCGHYVRGNGTVVTVCN